MNKIDCEPLHVQSAMDQSQCSKALNFEDKENKRKNGRQPDKNHLTLGDLNRGTANLQSYDEEQNFSNKSRDKKMRSPESQMKDSKPQIEGIG